ncbi:MAG: hypothetical protein GY771_12820 [bacterium]|nr:hypothetical protein [bacterium]
MKEHLNCNLSLIGNIAFIAIFTFLFAVPSPGIEYDFPQAKEKAELQEKLNFVKTIEVTDALELTDEEEDTFVSLYEELEQVRWDNHLRQMLMLQELRKELADDNETGVITILDEIERDGAETIFNEVRLRIRIRCLIGDENYARLMLFETSFDRKVRDIIMQRNVAAEAETDSAK